MRKTTIICIFIFNTLLTFSQLSIRSIESRQANEIKRIPHDTLSSFGYLRDSNYSKFIGQKILFYPRNKESQIDVNYYSNFYLIRPDTLWSEIPDTIWHVRRKKIRPKDFTTTPIVSDRYKATFIKQKKVCNGNEWLEYDKQRGFDIKQTGYFTPAEEIEGKAFEIINFRKECLESDKLNNSSDKKSNCKLYFTLISENKDTLIWSTYSLYDESRCFPATIVSNYEKMKELFVGKSYFHEAGKFISLGLNNGGNYAEVWGEFKCIDLSFTGSKDEFMTPKLIIQDEHNDLFAIDIQAKAPMMWSYLSMGRDLIKEDDKDYFNKDKIMTTKNIILSSIVKEKERIENEKKLSDEKNAKIEEQKRIANIRKKYSKHIADLILKGYVETGMTKKMCIESWGEPLDINTTTGSYGTHEQWVYGTSYLYFENGILTTIQN